MKGVIKVNAECMQENAVQNLIMDEFPGFKEIHSDDEAIYFEVEHPKIEMYCVHTVIISEDHIRLIDVFPTKSHSSPPLIDIN